ncbi:uncharacterized protein EV422DRAFT_192449 [Fimicolochytrium jonesii]|uniref:uncharacterized protein n=1 Tax=Fimicolochytrium jonesii TaxID=1396493 RepID=UPI0022FE0767|nr:uncharacterized protein EV422DRAFT_192449 [Fimicolochytrium jonesii]KAI8818154.1 hypothetical protein EV422DRAFT_192449 [Fimicolochytrium jonesii]
MPPKRATRKKKAPATSAQSAGASASSDDLAQAKLLPLFAHNQSHFTQVFNSGIAASQSDINTHVQFLFDYWKDILHGDVHENPQQMLKTPGKGRRFKNYAASPSGTARKISGRDKPTGQVDLDDRPILKLNKPEKRKHGKVRVEIPMTKGERQSTELMDNGGHSNSKRPRVRGVGSFEKGVHVGNNRSEAGEEPNAGASLAEAGNDTRENLDLSFTSRSVDDAIEESVNGDAENIADSSMVTTILEPATKPAGRTRVVEAVPEAQVPPVRASKRLEQRKPEAAEVDDSRFAKEKNISNGNSASQCNEAGVEDISESTEAGGSAGAQRAGSLRRTNSAGSEKSSGSTRLKVVRPGKVSDQIRKIESEEMRRREIQQVESRKSDADATASTVPKRSLGLRSSSASLAGRQVRVPTLNRLVAASQFADSSDEEDASFSAIFPAGQTRSGFAMSSPAGSKAGADSAAAEESVWEDVTVQLCEETPRPPKPGNKTQGSGPRQRSMDDMLLDTPNVNPTEEDTGDVTDMSIDASETPRPPSTLAVPTELVRRSDPSPIRPALVAESTHPASPNDRPASLYARIATQADQDRRSREQLWGKTIFQSEEFKKVKQGLEEKRRRLSAARAAAGDTAATSTSTLRSPVTRPAHKVSTPRSILKKRSSEVSQTKFPSRTNSLAPSELGSQQEWFEAQEPRPSQDVADKSAESRSPQNVRLPTAFQRSISGESKDSDTQGSADEDNGRISGEKSVTFQLPEQSDSDEESQSRMVEGDSDVEDVTVTVANNERRDDDTRQSMANSVDGDIDTERSSGLPSDRRSFGSQEQELLDNARDSVAGAAEHEIIKLVESPPPARPRFAASILGAIRSSLNKVAGTTFIPQPQAIRTATNKANPDMKSLNAAAAVKKLQADRDRRPIQSTVDSRLENAKQKQQRLQEEEAKRIEELARREEEKTRKAEEKKLEKLREQEAIKRKAAERQQAAAEKRAMDSKEKKQVKVMLKLPAKGAAASSHTQAQSSSSNELVRETVTHTERMTMQQRVSQYQTGPTTIVDENGNLPEPPSDYDSEDLQSSDDEVYSGSSKSGNVVGTPESSTPNPKKRKADEPEWVNTPELMKLIHAHERTDPDAVFGGARPPLEDVFKEGMKRKPFRARASSAWTGQDVLTASEDMEYKKSMGYL